MLCCIPTVQHIVTEKWIEDSWARKEFLDASNKLLWGVPSPAEVFTTAKMGLGLRSPMNIVGGQLVCLYSG